MTELSAALFDFSDTSDLSEDIAAKLSGDVNAKTNANAQAYGELVAAAGVPVSISQVIGAAERYFGAESVPTAATVRKYLNRAVANGVIGKPSKLTYGALSLGVVEDDDADDTVEGADVIVEEDDPLAGIELG